MQTPKPSSKRGSLTNRMHATLSSALEPAQRPAARIVGFLYLFTNATAIYAFSVRNKLIVPRDATQTATNIAGSELL